MSRLRALAWAWLPVLAWMAMILTLSSQSSLPARENPVTGEAIRSTYTLAKTAHVIEYSVLGLLILRAVTSPAGGVGLGFAGAALWAVIAATVFG
ncbi:MAG: VanZ family protein, partial [Chloroflexota bacterium]|nr:VanZ family protein [Chloroflexota bacterium]